tara:strand:- start:2549 stop:3193 length:645 start_codon:yes stop_codon:yes gene_type:complete
MNEEIEIISKNARNEKIKNFFVNNKKKIIIFFIIIILGIFGFFIYEDYKLKQKENLANKYNQGVIKHDLGQKNNIKKIFEEIVFARDNTYSPLAFYFLMDNDLITSRDEINDYFDILINETRLDEESKNLTIFKKGLFNSEFAKENDLLNILNPIIKSESIWKPHALYLMAEYYFANNEKQKSKEFLDQIISLEDVIPKIKIQAQKRLRLDFSE